MMHILIRYDQQLQSDALLLLTLECNNGCEGRETQGVGVVDQIIGLQSVSKGNPHQITKCQHEAKTIVHQVHGGQDGLLRRQRHSSLIWSQQLILL